MALKLVESRPATEEEKRKAEEVAADDEWLSDHSEEIWKRYKGKYIAVQNKLYLLETLMKSLLIKQNRNILMWNHWLNIFPIRGDSGSYDIPREI